MSGEVIPITGRAALRPEDLLLVTAPSTETTRIYRRAARRFIAWAAGRPLTAELFAGYIAELKGNGTTGSTVNRDLYGGKMAILQAAERAGLSARELAVLKTALDSLRPVHLGKPPIRTVNAEERAKLLAALSPRLRVLVRFLYATAARVSEALAVRETDIIWLAYGEADIARIRLMGKGSKQRWVKIPLSLLREINQVFQREGREYLFERVAGGRMTRYYVSHAIERAARRVLGRTVSAHDLRHSRATDLYQKTRRLKGVSEYLGHADVSTTARYYVRDELTDTELVQGEDL